MKNLRLVRFLLIIAGLIGILIGSAQLFMPVSFESGAGIDLGENSSLLSEIRGAGGVLLAGGILILSGVFYTRLIHLSLILSTLFFLSYGFARVLSMLIDGLPADSLIIATVSEVFIGLFSGLALYKLQKVKQINVLV